MITSLPSHLKLPTLILTTFLSYSGFTAAQTDNGDECSCFRTNGFSSAYYANHRFHDFRNINPSLVAIPGVLTDATNTTNAEESSQYFKNSSWCNDWVIQSWNNSDIFTSNNASILMINSPNNVYIESTDSDSSHKTHLTLRTTRTLEFQSAAEIDSTQNNFQYLSARFLARVIGSPGACAGLFTYRASSPVQEADIEILTTGPRNVIQYTNQPSNFPSGDIIPDATVNGSIPGGMDWSSWNTYRLDWTPKESVWFVNGDHAATISFQVPRDPAALYINMWGDGGPWTGNMTVYDAAYLQIQWIEVVFNKSGPYGGKRSTPIEEVKAASAGGCKVVCSVDEPINATTLVGTPVIVYNNTGAASSSQGQSRDLGGWMPGPLIGVLVGISLLV